MTITFHLREIDPTSEAEIDLVARRMQATLVEVEGEEMGLSLHSVPWLRDRVRWHLDPNAVQGRVVVAVNAQGEIIGHTLMRRELGEGEGECGPYGLVSTTYVMPNPPKLRILLLNNVKIQIKA
jgi:hypothetical protein